MLRSLLVLLFWSRRSAELFDSLVQHVSATGLLRTYEHQRHWFAYIRLAQLSQCYELPDSLYKLVSSWGVSDSLGAASFDDLVRLQRLAANGMLEVNSQLNWVGIPRLSPVCVSGRAAAQSFSSNTRLMFIWTFAKSLRSCTCLSFTQWLMLATWMCFAWCWMLAASLTSMLLAISATRCTTHVDSGLSKRSA